MSESIFNLDEELKVHADDKEFQNLAERLYQKLSNNKISPARISKVLDNLNVE